MIEKPQYFLGLLALLILALVFGNRGEDQEFAGRGADRLHLFQPSTLRELSEHLPNTMSTLDTGDLIVPNLAPSRLPRDLQIESGTRLKMLFIRSIVPHVLFQNRVIEQERQVLRTYATYIEQGTEIPADLGAAILSLADKYRVRTRMERGLPGPYTVRRLLKRVDIIPVSLAVAQAALESGWGRSRFALEGNNLFGHWKMEGPEGMVPQDRPEGERYSLAIFSDISQAVERYFLNLNTHPAYRKFREFRLSMREREMDQDAFLLAGTLENYSERGQDYIFDVVSLIRQNDLGLLDRAVLAHDLRHSGSVITLFLPNLESGSQSGGTTPPDTRFNGRV